MTTTLFGHPGQVSATDQATETDGRSSVIKRASLLFFKDFLLNFFR